MQQRVYFSKVYGEKKRQAEQQLEVAKELCDKLKKKRLSLVGAFVSTHSGSIEDVDRSAPPKFY